MDAPMKSISDDEWTHEGVFPTMGEPAKGRSRQ